MPVQPIPTHELATALRDELRSLATRFTLDTDRDRQAAVAALVFGHLNGWPPRVISYLAALLARVSEWRAATNVRDDVQSIAERLVADEVIRRNA